MKLVIILLFLLPAGCFSQSKFDIIQQKDVTICENGKGTFLTPAKINKENLLNFFGQPDKVVHEQVSWDEDVYYYDKNTFSVPIDSGYPSSYYLRTDRFSLIVNEKINIKVGNSVVDLLKYFPKSAQSVSDIESCCSNLIIKYGVIRNGRMIETDASIRIKYQKNDKKIILITESTLN